MTRRMNGSAMVFALCMAVGGLLFLNHLSSAAQRFVYTPAAATRAWQPSGVKADTVVLAGGCFWGVQSVFQHTKGVISATSGYAGGSTERPKYEMVSSGTTGHAESVRVTFDPAQISYEQVL